MRFAARTRRPTRFASLGLERHHGLDVALGDDEHVHRGLRIDVVEGQDLVVLVLDAGGTPAGDDLAEHAGGHKARTGAQRCPFAEACLEEHADQLRVELAGPGPLAEAPERVLLVEGGLVRALGAERVVDVDDRHEPREERHLLLAEPVGVAPPVPALVVVPDDGAHRAERPHRQDEAVAGGRVLFHEPALVRAEGTRLEEDAVGHRDLPQVVQEAAQAERLQLLRAEPQPLAELHRARGQPHAVPGRVRVPRLDREREARDQALRLLQLLEHPLQADQGPQPRAELARVDGLREVVVRAGGEPRHPGVQLSLGRQEDHRDEVRDRVALELPAEVDPGHPGHPHVQQDQVGELLGDLDERLGGGPHVADRIAEVRDVVPHRLADQKVVVDDQDPPEGDRVLRGRCHAGAIPGPNTASPAPVRDTSSGYPGLSATLCPQAR